jgi:hypothetical protein
MGTARTVVTITFTKGRFIMAWQSGPLPKDTYGWGGVVPFDLKGGGFFFADFRGDKVIAISRDPKDPNSTTRELAPHEVAMYDNSLTLPPDAIG